MISFLRGNVLQLEPPLLVLDVQGVGYEIEISLSLLEALPVVGKTTQLHTHLVVREDAHILYGFASAKEREVFRRLIRVNGVGPKLALAVVSHLNPDSLYHCVQSEDIATLVRVPGVGRKTAERLLIELRDRLPVPEQVPSVKASEAHADPDARQEAEAALLALGYRPQEATRSVEKYWEPGMNRDQLIRLILKNMVRA